MIKNSILLCTYNEARYIENTVLNLDKSIPDLEIIIVNDDSTDNTLSIIQKLKRQLTDFCVSSYYIICLHYYKIN